uniref:GGDEF and EAL domain-containing protein n=1 Tax=Thermodesulfobacterium geofontis TaxID=1295609 RepID=A0A7C4JQB1_9BACT
MDVFEMGYINLKYGFEKGKRLIEEIERFLRQNLRKEDLIGRIGPDEFLIFIEVKRKEDVFSVLKRIENFSSFKFEDINVFLTSGVSIYPFDGKNPLELFEKAGVALKEAKKSSPNAIVLYDKKFEDKILETLRIQTIIKEAIDINLFKFYYQPIFSSKFFRFYYQPIFSSKDLKPCSAEALARIASDNLYTASEFIYLLEVHPFIYEFEENLVKTSTFKSKNWGIPIHINVSEKTFIEGKIVENLKKYVKAGCKITVEIVERVIIKDFKKAVKTLEELKSLGVKIAIDDFGKGYSNLSLLSEIPVDIVKIDISLTRKINENEKAKVLIDSIAELCKKLGIKTIAEGVETEEELNFLKEHCDYLQGYLLGKPLSQDEFEEKFKLKLNL